jgi:F0F1-type ATP synthase gamma subunit
MTEQLQYSYNQLRQAGITQEINEITTGKLALEE